MTRTLIVLPDDSARPIVDAIHSATQSLRLKMFVLSAPALLKALVGAHHRGVQVRVILNGARRSGQKDNDYYLKAFERAEMEVREGNPAIELTHEKSLVVHDGSAVVMSMNWATRNLTESRDCGFWTTWASRSTSSST